jgi:hypothetical protein
MGGWGSGRTSARSLSKKAIVEECLVLTAATLVRQKALVPGVRTTGSWSWGYDGDERARRGISLGVPTVTTSAFSCFALVPR